MKIPKEPLLFLNWLLNGLVVAVLLELGLFLVLCAAGVVLFIFTFGGGWSGWPFYTLFDLAFRLLWLSRYLYFPVCLGALLYTLSGPEGDRRLRDKVFLKSLCFTFLAAGAVFAEFFIKM